MALILTYLGKGGSGCTTVAIAAAKRLASEGKRTLLVSQNTGPTLDILLGQAVAATPTVIEANLSVLQFQSTALLQAAWELLKQREAQYLRDPFFKNVYGEELGVLPGMDAALAMNALREQAQSGNYDAIVYDGRSGMETLRNLGSLEVTSWYVRRFSKVIADSDVFRSIQPFFQPVASAVLNSGWGSSPSSVDPMDESTALLEEGRAALADRAQTMAYLVTTGDELANAQATYLWGSAQQVGLHVGGVLVNAAVGAGQAEEVGDRFNPLPVSTLPQRGDDWQSLIDALPDPAQAATAPSPQNFDAAANQMRVFLPGFDKSQVKLTQYNQEITIEAGDQRRNIVLPAGLKGRSVTGAKFQDQHLVLSF